MKARHIWQLLLATLLAMVATACDSVVLVKGEISGTTELCRLDFLRAGSDETVQWRQIQGAFGTSFTVSPGASSYYFVLACPGYRPLTTMEYGAGVESLTEIDLGTLQVERLSQ